MYICRDGKKCTIVGRGAFKHNGSQSIGSASIIVYICHILRPIIYL
jgi:hypothetical protein